MWHSSCSSTTSWCIIILFSFISGPDLSWLLMMLDAISRCSSSISTWAPRDHGNAFVFLDYSRVLNSFLLNSPSFGSITLQIRLNRWITESILALIMRQYLYQVSKVHNHCYFNIGAWKMVHRYVINWWLLFTLG